MDFGLPMNSPNESKKFEQMMDVPKSQKSKSEKGCESLRKFLLFCISQNS